MPLLAPWLVLAALCGADAPDAGAPARQVIDRIVAIVERQPLLLSDLEFEARIALIQQGGALAVSAPLGDDDLAAALEWSIEQRLLLTEAERLRAFELDEATAARTYKSFVEKIAGPRKLEAFLASQEATESQLTAVLLRSARVARFLDSKMGLSRVTEEELTRWYAAHASELGGQPYEKMREGIRTRLTRERYRTLVKKQLDDLRSKADVRIVAPFGKRPAADPVP